MKLLNHKGHQGHKERGAMNYEPIPAEDEALGHKIIGAAIRTTKDTKNTKEDQPGL